MSQHEDSHRRRSQHYQEDAGEYKWIKAGDVWIEDAMFHICPYRFDREWLTSMMLLITDDAMHFITSSFFSSFF